MSERYVIRMAVYVIFERDGKVLLSLRHNTGYKDGLYGWVQGHVEAGEEIKMAAIREAKEEAGVDVESGDMQLVAITHQEIDAPYIDFVFVCRNWKGDLHNCEKEVCNKMQWFAPKELPSNVLVQVREYVKLINNRALEFFEFKN